MTEAEWLECGEAWQLDNAVREQVSTRKVRLFLAACCRSVWNSLPADCHKVIQVNELFADGQVGPKEMESACLACRGISTNLEMRVIESMMAWRPSFTPLNEVALERAGKAGDISPNTLARFAAGHADLFREVIGNPFRPVSINQSWLDWNDSAVVRLAQAAYDERELSSGHLDTHRLAILADALEEAGCSDAEVLTHLRDPGPHVRGCWVLDLLLGKQ
jgi:hypothetical protein